MRIGVLIKQVPDMEKVKFDTERGVVDRSSAGTEINPFDLNALETAVQISENIEAEVSIVAISMGPASAEFVLREVIARGADEGILLTDKNFAGSDTLMTSLTLSEAIQKKYCFDLIIAGMMSVDGDTAQVGPQIAEILQIPHASFVSEINKISDDHIDIVSDAFDGTYLKKLNFPCLISVLKDINIPRLPSLHDKIKSKRVKITSWSVDDLYEDLTAKQFGIHGSPSKVQNIIVPSTDRRTGKVYKEDEKDDAIFDIINELQDHKLVNKRND